MGFWLTLFAMTMAMIFGVRFEYDAPHDPFDDLLAAYGMPVNIILESPINKAGRLQAVYVNSGSSNGYYEVKGHAKVPIGPKGFQQMWRELHQSGGVLQQGTEAVAWHENCGIPSLVEGLPANSRKIGVLSGKGRGTDLDTYILAAPSDQTLVFVVGEFANEGIENYIDEYVEVSGYSLAPSVCVGHICCALGKKWNIC
ncbi:hypothetical protein PRUPE_1G568900 [Prunus persica]|uniref:tRNA/rRNA methyltransferase SpoU type domain-containing protein n=1 Tax=Prunus persica TaxID=3760 RepID=A0A251RJ35_PRUPE|nr:hypothetical protein PRUPE_1G568900 [Prunus persica]